MISCLLIISCLFISGFVSFVYNFLANAAIIPIGIVIKVPRPNFLYAELDFEDLPKEFKAKQHRRERKTEEEKIR